MSHNSEPSPPDDAPNRHQSLSTRRALLQSAGVAGITLSAGCEIPFIDSLKLPALTDGWSDIRRDGSVGLILAFDGDIQGKLEKYPISKADIMSTLEEKGYSVSFQPVSIQGAESMPNKQRISCVIDGLGSVTSWPGGKQYHAEDGFFLPEKIPVKDTSETVPAPTKDPPFRAQFPSGYRYYLPKIQKRAANNTNLDRAYNGLFNYKGRPHHRTIPLINHYDPTVAAEARLFDAYRKHVCEQFKTLTDTTHYENGQISQTLKDAVTKLAFDIGWEGVTMFVPTPGGFFPQVLDSISSVHSALSTRRPRLQKALKAFEEQAKDFQQHAWLTDLHSDMGILEHKADQCFWSYNPAWTNAPSRSLANNHLQTYRTQLEEQHSRLKIAAFERSNDVSYWQSDYVKDLVMTIEKVSREMYSEIDGIIDELRTIESAFP